VNRAELRLVCAGAAAVGTAYGLARYGYGLLLPDIRAELGLGTTVLGAIGTGSYASYLAATAAVSVLAPRAGSRAMVAAGLVLAAVGMVLIATAAGPLSLALGMAVAGASSGFVFLLAGPIGLGGTFAVAAAVVMGAAALLPREAIASARKPSTGLICEA
jgi:fucose permease